MKEGEVVQPMSPVTGPMVVENPKIHDKIYRWCSCGQSLKQPFCDGSHKGTSFTPVKVTAEEGKRMFFCGCKASAKAPFCDGTHSRL